MRQSKFKLEIEKPLQIRLTYREFYALLALFGGFSWVAYYLTLNTVDYLRMPKLLWAVVITIYLLIVLTSNIICKLFEKEEPVP